MTRSISPNDNVDEELITKIVGLVGKGSGILLIGSILGLLCQFIAQIVIARFYSPPEYGLFNLFLTVLTIAGGIGTLGLSSGISRFIGYYAGSGEKQKIKAVESWGLVIGFISGIFFGIVLYFTSPYIASIFSEKSEFANFLIIAAFTLPFFVILNLLLSIFLGHKRCNEKVIFYDLGRNIAFLSLCFFIGIFSLPFIGIIWAMFVSTTLMTILFFVYYLNKRKKLNNEVRSFLFDSSIGTKMLIFSLPILFVGLMDNLTGWTDTLMIGHFLPASDVGFYNVAKPLSLLINTALTASAFIYLPLTAGLYAQKKFNENNVIYSFLTKWICFLTLPVAMVLFFFSYKIITIFFGFDYLPAVIPLQILIIPYLIQVIVGPAGYTLTAYGETKFLMYLTFSVVGLNIILNYILIPIFGIIGAAISTGISIFILTAMKVSKLYSISNTHSFKSDILKPVLLTIFIGSPISYLLEKTLIPGILQIIITFGLLYILFFILMLVTHSISKQDLYFFIMLEKKIGLNLSAVKKLLKKFI